MMVVHPLVLSLGVMGAYVAIHAIAVVLARLTGGPDD